MRYSVPVPDYIGETERKWSSMEDQAIIALFLERSERGIAALISKYGRAVTKVIGNILADPLDAEECANDTYLGVWNSIPPNIPMSLGGLLLRHCPESGPEPLSVQHREETQLSF